MSELAVATFGVTRRFGDVLAVDAVDLRVPRGEIYGFLGRNGAGKSTTIRMLLGMITPTAGHVELLGQRVHRDAPALWRRVGHLVETAVAYPELTVRENLEVARRLQGRRGGVEEVVGRLRLGPYANRRARDLSLGNLQRLALGRALLHRPELLVLDEPANGLDPAGVVEVRELLRELVREEGVTVFMSSHHLAEVDRLATRIGIVHQGRLIEELGADELEARRGCRLEVGARDIEGALAALRKAGFAPRVGPTGIELYEDNAVSAPDDVARALVAGGTAPTRLAVVQEDLEQHFMRLTGGTG